MAHASGLPWDAMLVVVHVVQPDVAERVRNAWLRTFDKVQPLSEKRIDVAKAGHLRNDEGEAGFTLAQGE